jgi:cell division cycle 14
MYLMAGFLIICFKLTAEQAWEPFAQSGKKPLPFVDAGEEPGPFELELPDCLRGLEFAVNKGWYDFKKFDYKLYENYHRLDVGDMNWVIPGKLLALSSPTNSKSDGLRPEAFLANFAKLNVRAVVRLNEPLYDARVF